MCEPNLRHLSYRRPTTSSSTSCRRVGIASGVALIIGCSGWQYRDWRGVLYPPGLPQHAWLTTYARAFSTVEVNNTFYRLPERETFEGWARQLPEGFVMAVKMSRYLTHVRRLSDPAEPLARFLDRARGLQPSACLTSSEAHRP